MKKIFILLLLLLMVDCGWAQSIPIVAAENFYGEIARQLGGPYVQVTSILKNPQQDPHLFSADPATAKAITQAQYVVFNGLDYDNWIFPLLASAKKNAPQLVNIAELNGKKNGDNPHIWYNPETMSTYAGFLTDKLSASDKTHESYFRDQLKEFLKNHQTLMDKIQSLKSQYQGVAVIATEPVFNDMAQLIGLQMQGLDFQLSIMNGTEPSISAIKNFENLLTRRQVKLLLYNNQVINPTTERMRQLAAQNNIPSLGVSETQPQGQTYFTWMNSQLDELAQLLGPVGPR